MNSLKVPPLSVLHLFFTPLLGIPTSIYVGYLVVSSGSLPESLRYLFQGMAFLFSYPVYLAGVILLRKYSHASLAVVFSGILLRLSGLGLVAVFTMLNLRAFGRSPLWLYFITIAIFLFFELVSIPGLLFYAQKSD